MLAACRKSNKGSAMFMLLPELFKLSSKDPQTVPHRKWKIVSRKRRKTIVWNITKIFGVTCCTRSDLNSISSSISSRSNFPFDLSSCSIRDETIASRFLGNINSITSLENVIKFLMQHTRWLKIRIHLNKSKFILGEQQIKRYVPTVLSQKRNQFRDVRCPFRSFDGNILKYHKPW